MDFVGLLVNSYPVYTSLMHVLDTVSVWRLSSTCKTLQELIRPQQWNINRSLSWFIHDPLAFRKKLQEVGGVISGGFVLQFLDRQVWPESDLDVYLNEFKACSIMLEFLVKTYGYTLKEASSEDYIGCPGLQVSLTMCLYDIC